MSSIRPSVKYLWEPSCLNPSVYKNWFCSFQKCLGGCCKEPWASQVFMLRMAEISWRGTNRCMSGKGWGAPGRERAYLCMTCHHLADVLQPPWSTELGKAAPLQLLLRGLMPVPVHTREKVTHLITVTSNRCLAWGQHLSTKGGE